MRQGHTARGGGEPVSEPRARAGPRELQVSAQSPAVKQREATSLQPDPRGLMLFTRHFPGKGPVSGPLSRQPERGDGPPRPLGPSRRVGGPRPWADVLGRAAGVSSGSDPGPRPLPAACPPLGDATQWGPGCGWRWRCLSPGSPEASGGLEGPPTPRREVSQVKATGDRCGFSQGEVKVLHVHLSRGGHKVSRWKPYTVI